MVHEILMNKLSSFDPTKFGLFMSYELFCWIGLYRVLFPTLNWQFTYSKKRASVFFLQSRTQFLTTWDLILGLWILGSFSAITSMIIFHCCLAVASASGGGVQTHKEINLVVFDAHYYVPNLSIRKEFS